MNRPQIEDVKKKYQKKLMKMRGVVGIGIAEDKGEKVIKVMVVKHTKSIDKKVPKMLEGYRVIIAETGIIRTF